MPGGLHLDRKPSAEAARRIIRRESHTGGGTHSNKKEMVPRFTYFQPIIEVSKGGFEGGYIDPPRFDIIHKPAEYVPLKVGVGVQSLCQCVVARPATVQF